MRIISKLLDDVYVIESPAFSDHRGGFTKLFHRSIPTLKKYQIEQINFVENKHKNILRGLHYQEGCFAESKFFRVLSGKVQLAFVDLRDPQKGPIAESFVLDTPNIGLLIPKGFATGYLTIEPNSIVLYYSDNQYQPTAEKGLRWNDPLLKIDWQCRQPKLSEKDKQWSDFQPNNFDQ